MEVFKLLCAVCIVSLQLHQVWITPLASRELRMYRDPSMQCNTYKICQKKKKNRTQYAHSPPHHTQTTHKHAPLQAVLESEL